MNSPLTRGMGRRPQQPNAVPKQGPQKTFRMVLCDPQFGV